MSASTYTVIVFQPADRTDAQVLADREPLEVLWRMHLAKEKAVPEGMPTMTIIHGPPRKALRLVRDDGFPDSATIAIRIEGPARAWSR